MGVRTLRSSFTLSLALHGFGFLVCALWLARNPVSVKAPRQLEWVELATTVPARPKPAAESKPEEDRIRRRMVQTERAEETARAPDDAFLGERNQQVDRQTVSRSKMIAMGSKADAHPPSQAQPKRAAAVAKTVTPAPAARAGQLEALKGLGVAMIPKAAPREGSRLSDESNRRWAESTQSEGQAPQDYIEGLKESERTALSTKEFVYFGYYQRIRERLDRAWVPILREKLMAFYRSGRHLASDIDHSTRVLVILNPQGEIVQVKLLSESGTHDLDEAAIKAFNRAGPFPNPPRGIVGSDGQVQIPWEFILRS